MDGDYGAATKGTKDHKNEQPKDKGIRMVSTVRGVRAIRGQLSFVFFLFCGVLSLLWLVLSR
jgi:hypothetical protein